MKHSIKFNYVVFLMKSLYDANLIVFLILQKNKDKKVDVRKQISVGSRKLS